MVNNLSFTRECGSGCRIYRETTGHYVVHHPLAPEQSVRVATLAGAYAACQGIEIRTHGPGALGATTGIKTSSGGRRV